MAIELGLCEGKNIPQTCSETLVTSTSEVVVPGCTDFIRMLVDHPLGRVQPVGTESVVPRQLDVGLDPELRLPVAW